MNRFVARCRLLLRKLKLRAARKLVVAFTGGSVALVGVAMIVLPGPAFLVIPLGLAILATEFRWARLWLKRAREMLSGCDKPSSAAGIIHVWHQLSVFDIKRYLRVRHDTFQSLETTAAGISNHWKNSLAYESNRHQVRK